MNNDQNRNVILMSGFLKDTQYSAIQQVEAYWEGLRGNRIMPKRSEIDPRGIENALEYAFILERIAPGIARIRIAGSHLSDLMGMEVRGMPITSFFTPDTRRAFSDTLEGLFDQPAIAELNLTAERGMGKPELDGRLLLLPLKSDLGDVSRVLGCLMTTGQVGRHPRRFNLTGQTLRPILHMASGAAPKPAAPKKPAYKAPTEAEKVAMRKAKTPGFAEKKPSFDRPGRATQVPYLRVINSDEE